MRVRWRCGGGDAVLCASKGLVLGAGARVRVYTSKDKMAWFGAVLSAMVGCKVKVLG